MKKLKSISGYEIGDLLTTDGKDVFRITSSHTITAYMVADLINNQMKSMLPEEIEAAEMKKLTADRCDKKISKKPPKAETRTTNVKSKKGSPFPGVSYDDRRPDAPWRAQVNRDTVFLSRHFVDPEEGYKWLISEIAKRGLKPLRGTKKLA